MTPVIFRKWEEGERTGIIACFPTIPGAPGLATCYEHIGQHSSYCHEWYIATHEAKPEEYSNLLNELQSIGYDDLKIYRHHQRWMDTDRRRAEKE